MLYNLKFLHASLSTCSNYRGFCYITYELDTLLQLSSLHDLHVEQLNPCSCFQDYLLSRSMTEDEVYQIMVVSNPEVMKQLAGCLQTPTFTHFVHTRVLCCLENLSYNSSTHRFICTPDIISAAINSPDLPSSQVQLGDMDQALCTKLECDLVR